MIYSDFKSFPKSGKLLGIDWGEKRIGLAVSDPDRNFTFFRPANGDILKTIKEENIKGIVLGLPLRLDGTDSPTTKRVREFAKRLTQETDIPIILFDESLTSFAASTNIKDNKALDSESARILLDNAISMMSRL